MFKSDYSRIFDLDDIPPRAKIVIYGAGKMGRKLKREIDNVKDIEGVAWVDRNPQIYTEVLTPDKIPLYEYDYVLISIANIDVVKEVYSYLDELGVEKKR